MKKISLLIFIASLFLFQGCYEDFKEDFAYSTTYFARQSPVRTLVDAEGEDLKFELGAVLGGKYSNGSNEQVTFAVNPNYLDETLFPTLTGLEDEDPPAGLAGLTLLPDNYYSLESNTITIPSGKFIGSTSVTLNKELISNDPLAIANNYVLPVEITEATSDSVLNGKHYALIVVKYFNQYQGWYYVKGSDATVGGDTVEYSNDDLVLNEDVLLETLSGNELSVPYVGNPVVNDREMNFSISNDGAVTITDGNPGGGVSAISGTGTYDSSTRNFTLQYSYTDGDNNVHNVNETLTYRNTELVLENWN